MRLAPFFGIYCLLVLTFYSFARVEGWSLFGVSGRAAAASGVSNTGGRYGGVSGYHK